MKKLIWIVGAMGILIVIFSFSKNRNSGESLIQPQTLIDRRPVLPSEGSNVMQKAESGYVFPSHFRKRASNFSQSERDKFLLDFEQRYRPAISNWCDAFAGHLPFRFDEVTPEKLVERFSKDDSFAEHVFVINGITLGIRDSRGTAVVDYLNNPEQTKKLAVLPKNAGPPIVEMPLSREDVIKIIEADSGKTYQPYEVRMKPSGFSGSLNGGAFVQIGGDPANGATWNYDLVFASDSQLAFYLRGIQRERPSSP